MIIIFAIQCRDLCFYASRYTVICIDTLQSNRIQASKSTAEIAGAHKPVATAISDNCASRSSSYFYVPGCS